MAGCVRAGGAGPAGPATGAEGVVVTHGTDTKALMALMVALADSGADGVGAWFARHVPAPPA